MIFKEFKEYINSYDCPDDVEVMVSCYDWDMAKWVYYPIGSMERDIYASMEDLLRHFDIFDIAAEKIEPMEEPNDETS